MLVKTNVILRKSRSGVAEPGSAVVERVGLADIADMLAHTMYVDSIVSCPDFDANEVWIEGDRYLLITGAMTGTSIKIRLPS